jgi:hypothetical protein
MQIFLGGLNDDEDYADEDEEEGSGQSTIERLRQRLRTSS